MPDPATLSTSPERSPRGLSHRTKWFLLAMLAAGLLLVAGGVIFMRSAARVNRLLPTVGLPQVPSAARNLLVQRRRRLFVTRVTYVRFEAPADAIAQFVRPSSTATVDGPAPMASLSFGPRCPVWMRWERTVQGRIYHWTADRVSVWLAIDDESQTVYVGVFESRSPWLRRLFD